MQNGDRIPEIVLARASELLVVAVKPVIIQDKQRRFARFITVQFDPDHSNVQDNVGRSRVVSFHELDLHIAPFGKGDFGITVTVNAGFILSSDIIIKIPAVFMEVEDAEHIPVVTLPEFMQLIVVIDIMIKWST
jgi:hypothetical protein